jgi:hypothetical protein
MRRTSLFALLALVAALPATHAYAQSQQSQDDQRRQAEAEEDAKKKQKDKEWKLQQGPLPDVKNAGPCPYVKTLYDASRYVELKGGQESAGAVGFTGEIQKIQATCAYKGGEPIHVAMAVNMAFGRGPQAEGYSKDYRYWVAVTVRNETVLDKQYFTVPVVFRPGEDRASYVDRIEDIVIPRAKATVSGANFEVLVGFDVTPQMAEFNRLGKRFRENAGEQTADNSGANTGAAGTK